MRCPYCQHVRSDTVDSRPVDDGTAQRRRRECPHCHRRWTTHERIRDKGRMVQHRDGKVESFSRDTLLDRLMRHCVKLQVWPQDARIASEKLLVRLCDKGKLLSTEEIAEEMMVTLLELHPMACLRFELEWYRPANAADMLGIVWQFAHRTGILQKQG